MEKKETIISKTYDMLLYVIPVLEKYPRNQKFILADRIENALLNILDKFLEAYFYDKADKGKLLEYINVELEKLRYLIRLSYDLRCINIDKYEKITFRINEVGKMSGGWRKSLK
jgi:four helix bundle protein